ncbi:MAG TPA: thioredoxin domain-containing protein [Rudaea sp.]|jgi:hypothetical protein|uniref:thioredoxin domain-containing protein n=1 Tax=Rudaea sp. TaxID=2136325 RepID=UPI002F95E635
MSNRLSQEASPYLRQHAHNPVDWWPWNADALAAARAQDKPILLSIGYSACHWCHVMAHESFEDAATARVMNDKFICIKVDREERPDLDKIYQLAHQALTRRGGGWPLTMFLAPDDLTPFYAGTYFPKQARYGMPPFAYVLEQVRGLWDQRRGDVRAQNATLREFLEQYGDGATHTDALGDAPVRAALAQIGQNFDRTHGGHLGAPKFPHCAEMELLLDLDTDDTRSMVELTLTRMADGGIHDQIGGGFCRYSVDQRWEIPHFEKMLYDNAQLLPLYAIRARATGNAQYLRAAQELVAWLAREMTATSMQSGGAFYAALDADSEGEEGKFYIWQRDEVRALLSDDEFAVAERHYGFDRAPNFEGTHWNPIVAEPVAAIAAASKRTTADIEAVIARARAKLFAARSPRVRPGLDDKILTAWNALMIAGLARAARALDTPALTALAANAIEFLHAQSWRDDRLFASHAGGVAKLPAYLDDYVFLLDALLEFLQCHWNDRYLAWARQLADALLDRFEDRARGGFWFTANDHENLIQRPKPWADDAVPSGNGIAARALLRLGHLVGETRYLDAAERTLRAAFSTMQSMPQGCASLQRALNDFLHPRTHVVVRFDSDAEEKAWRSTLSADTPQRTDVYFIPASADGLGGILDAQKYDSGGVAYLCRGTQCLPPLATPQALAAALRAP